MSTDIDFVKFVKQRKHAKPDMEDLYEIDFLGRKKAGVSFNDTVRNEVKKVKLKEGDTSLSDFLSKNKNKIVEEPKKEIIKEEKEESDNDSEDFSEEKINHYIGGEKNNIDEMEEIINEIKDRTQIIKSKRDKKDKKNKKEKKNKKDKNNKKNNNKELNLDEDNEDNDDGIDKNNE